MESSIPSDVKARLYRPEIDGLRAIAVAVVILYHLGFAPFSGGYVGVDVFFVISGFLITSIINSEIEKGSFSIAAFYERRVRRIIPALYAVIICSVGLSFFILLPQDMRTLANAAASSVTFLANIYYWKTSGYFDWSSEYSAFIHTWSLAVEEQFYIVFPIALLFVSRYFPNNRFHIIAVVATASFILCLLISSFSQVAAFYLAPLRAWELMVGSMLAFAPPLAQSCGQFANLCSAFAVVLLLFSVVYYDKTTHFPGWSAMPPVAATALLIYYANGNLSARLLRYRPIVAIGLISYSLYLWHWPILVFWKYYNFLEISEGARWELLAISIGLATLSYHFVERPFRTRADGMTRPRLFLSALVVTAGLLGGSAFVRYGEGFPARFSADIVALDRERSPPIPYLECIDDSAFSMHFRSGEFCDLGDRGRKPTTLLWGDSHLLAWAPAFHAVFLDHGQSATFAAASACPPLIRPQNEKCAERSEATLRCLNAHSEIHTVILVAAWSRYSDSGGGRAELGGSDGAASAFPRAFRSTIATLGVAGRHVVIIGPTPGAPHGGPLGMALARLRKAAFPDPISFTDYLDHNRIALALSLEAAKHERVDFVDVAPWFCADGRCEYESGGLPLYRDGGHLNVRGAMSKVDHLASALTGVGLW